MAKYKKCPNCKIKGLYIGDGGDVCCFCGQTAPNKMYGEMERKELEWHIRRLEERLDSRVIKVSYKNNVKWANMKEKLNDINTKRKWCVSVGLVVIGIIVTVVIALFVP